MPPRIDDHAISSSTGHMHPLIVDLDGTLTKTDLLQEAANELIVRRPRFLLCIVVWMFKGRANLKEQLATRTQLDVDTLPYNQRVVAWLRAQRKAGRHVVLATASARVLADRVASSIGVFDEVLATENAINLKGIAKRDLLVRRYGIRRFDYVGNERADIIVWGAAARAHVVSSSPRLLNNVRAIGNVDRVFNDRMTPIRRALFTALRPQQWIKNVLVLVPLFAAHQYTSRTSILLAVIGALAFCIASSGAYVLNDLIDVTNDRYHPTKRKRPFASGDLSLLTGWLLWPTMIIGALAIGSAFLPLRFVAALGAYLGLTVAYSLRLKQIAIVDVLTLATLYTLRIVAGAAAISVPVSFWMLAFAMFLFLSLALIKRYSELKTARLDGRDGQIRGRGYLAEDLELVSSLGAAAGYLATLVLALYVQDPHTGELYQSPTVIWLACPLLLFWISRAWLIAHRGLMHEDPIVFALTDRVSWLAGAVLALIFTLASLT